MTKSDVTALFAYISSVYTNFAKGKSDEMKRAMIGAWADALSDVPLQAALDAVKQQLTNGAMFPPSSPAELRKIACAPGHVNGMNLKFYDDMERVGIFTHEQAEALRMREMRKGIAGTPERQQIGGGI